MRSVTFSDLHTPWLTVTIQSDTILVRTISAIKSQWLIITTNLLPLLAASNAMQQFTVHNSSAVTYQMRDNYRICRKQGACPIYGAPPF